LRFSASPCLVDSLKSYQIIEISCGGGHSLALSSDSSLFSWGLGETGALGTGSLQTQWAPVTVKLPNLFRASSVSCGSKHSALIGRSQTSGLSVLVSGSGDSGQLGTGKREKELTFVTIRIPEEPQQVSCGVFHTGILSITGNVFMTGGNAFGQLGLGNKKGTCIPRRVESLSSVCKLVCSSHSSALTQSGDLYVWGTGMFGEFVSPTRIAGRCKDVAVGGNFTLILDDRENLHTWGSNLNGELGLGDFEARNSPTHVQSLQGKHVSRIACGSNFVLALGEDVKYQSTRHKTSTPLRQVKENDDFKITLHESPVAPNRGKVFQRKNGFEDDREEMPLNHFENRENIENRDKIDRKWNPDDRNSDFFMKELERAKDESYKLLVELQREQNRSKNLNNELEELRRVNENLRNNEHRLQHDQLVGQTQALEAQRLRVLVEESKHLNFSLEIENKSLKEEVHRQEDLLKAKEREFFDTLRLKLAAQESHMKEVQLQLKNELETRIETQEIEIKQLESNFALTSNQKNRLEDVLSISSAQIGELETQLFEYEKKIEQLENSLANSSGLKMRAEENLSNTSHQLNELSKRLERCESDLLRREEDLSQTKLLKSKLEEDLLEKTSQNHSLFQKLQIYESELSQQSSELSHFKSEKNHLEEVFQNASNQNIDLATQVQILKTTQNSLESSKLDLLSNLESVIQEFNEFKQETVEKDLKRENLIKLIEEKTQELENDRCRLVSEKDLLQRATSDLSFQIAKLNQNLSESNHQVNLLEESLAFEISKTSKLMIDLETANESIVILELKNQEIFENLQKELAQRAKDYKERTLNLLNTPSRGFGRQNLEQSTYHYSPTKESVRSPNETEIRSPPRPRRSPVKETLHYSTMPSIELMGKTPHRASSLSKSQQDRINAAALKLMRQHESPLRNIRVSSPSRRSPVRPSPYRTYA
jgi:hypothetical protein